DVAHSKIWQRFRRQNLSNSLTRTKQSGKKVRQRSLGSGGTMAADSAWRLGGLSAKELGQRVWREFNQDEILDRSAALSYYFLGAIFPLLLVLFSILGLLATPGSQIRETIMRYANVVLPGSASGLIQ